MQDEVGEAATDPERGLDPTSFFICAVTDETGSSGSAIVLVDDQERMAVISRDSDDVITGFEFLE